MSRVTVKIGQRKTLFRLKFFSYTNNSVFKNRKSHHSQFEKFIYYIWIYTFCNKKKASQYIEPSYKWNKKIKFHLFINGVKLTSTRYHIYVCPAVYVNSSLKWPWERNGISLLGTVVLLLNIYIITHVDIFKLATSNVKHSKYIQILQFSIFWINHWYLHLKTFRLNIF